MTFAGFIGALILAFIAALAGGAVGGILVGGKDLGNELAAMMSAFYGPLAGFIGVGVGLLLFALVA
jgi:hypothetical protein